MTIDKIASSIYLDLVGGNLIPSSDSQLVSKEQIEDEVVDERCTVIKEWYLKGIIKANDLMYALNCVELDCADQNKCSACSDVFIENTKNAKHFEIPMLMPGLGKDAILFIGSTDRTQAFKVYFQNTQLHKYNKYRKSNSNKPYVYIERTPNSNNKYDCWVFNAPFVKYISVIAVFKDLRDLEEYDCCKTEEYSDLGIVSGEVQKRVLQKKIQLYRTPVVFPAKSIE